MSQVRQQLTTAMELQQKRCEVYHLWKSKFRSVIEGSLSVKDFDEIIRTVIVKEFQSVSVALRALHHEVHQDLQRDPLYHAKEQHNSSHSDKDGEGVTATAGGQHHPLPPSSSSLASHSGSSSVASSRGDEMYLAEVLLKWIDELQDVEHDHYNTTIECLKMVVTHTAPNVMKKPTSSQSMETQEKSTPQQAADEKTGQATSPLTAPSATPAPGSCAAEAALHNDGVRATTAALANTDNDAAQKQPTQPPTAADEALPELKPHYSVHDADTCALRHIYPQSILAKFHFVNCRAAFDTLAATEEAEDMDGPNTQGAALDAAPNDDASSSPARTAASLLATGDARLLLPLVRSPDALLNARTAEERDALILGYYDPAVVSQQCSLWSGEMLKVLARQQDLEQTASALVEDLQCELSDLAP